MKSHNPLLATLALAMMVATGVAAAGSVSGARQGILDAYAADARRTDPAFHGFSASAGQSFFLAHPAGGHPETLSCTVCHTQSPLNAGRTRAGKDLSPMAVSRSPARFTDVTKVERWFARNCRTVYGRLCTPVEKGNFITFMSSL
jgi:hypothetical protein